MLFHISLLFFFFFFHDTATTEIYTLSLHDALPISHGSEAMGSSLPSTLISISRAFTARSTMIRRSWRAASSSAADSAGAVATLLMPTLEPRLEGLTKHGKPISSATRLATAAG